MAEIENLQIVGGAIYTVGNQDIIADDWEAGKTYIKDRSYAIKDHKLYQCAVSHTSVEPFDPTKWTEKTVAEALGTAGSANMIECTLAEYTAWKAGGQLINETVYVITDAPNLNATAQDISYDGGADTVWDKVEAKANTSDLPTWITQASGTNSGTIAGASVFGYYYADQWQAYIYLPFVAKNTNYTVNLTSVSADNIGDVTSKCSVVAKQNGYFTVRTTKTMSNLPDYYSVCPMRITYSIDFA